MKLETMVEKARELAGSYRVTSGRGFRLDRRDPGDTGPFDGGDKNRARKLLAEGVEGLTELQDRLYAQDRWAVLLVFQALDAAGKDGAIEHVMSGVNPQGCQVASFKAPSDEELDHDYLWRCQRHLPERGRIGIFNRSYYEEVLVVRVHPEMLERQKLPKGLAGPGIWRRRFGEIRDFERHLGANGTLVRKFFLHVSREEQRRRFLARIEDPAKNWKFSARDVAEREHWDAYQEAYEKAIRATATPEAPWYVVPADHKWFTRLVVAAAVIDALATVDPRYPELSAEARRALEAAGERLRSES
jgi:PPK2 family polyphosphate:nucleotide phosphotransferase